MKTGIERTIVEWALAHDDDLRLYRAVDASWVEPTENTEDEDGQTVYGTANDWQGSAPGFHGGEIHLIAQNDENGCIYAETTTDLDAADYLIGSAGLCDYQDLQSALRAIRDLLDGVFGDVWPDNYAQCHGWYL
jgi:hypothetical protein